MVLLFPSRVAPRNALLSSDGGSQPGSHWANTTRRRTHHQWERQPPGARAGPLPAPSGPQPPPPEQGSEPEKGEKTCPPFFSKWYTMIQWWSTNHTGRDERGLSQETFLCAERRRQARESLPDATSHSGLWTLSFSLTHRGRQSLQTEGSRVLDDLIECLKQTKKSLKQTRHEKESDTT